MKITPSQADGARLETVDARVGDQHRLDHALVACLDPRFRLGG
jgi:hypothetical protein